MVSPRPPRPPRRRLRRRRPDRPRRRRRRRPRQRPRHRQRRGLEERMFRRALRLRTTKAAMIFAAVVGVALCFSPLLGVHGPESGLVLAVLLPPWAGAIGVRLVT